MLCPLCKTNCGTKNAEEFPNNVYAMQFMELVNQKQEEMQVTLIILYNETKNSTSYVFKGSKTGAWLVERQLARLASRSTPRWAWWTRRTASRTKWRKSIPTWTQPSTRGRRPVSSCRPLWSPWKQKKLPPWSFWNRLKPKKSLPESSWLKIKSTWISSTCLWRALQATCRLEHIPSVKSTRPSMLPSSSRERSLSVPICSSKSWTDPKRNIRRVRVRPMRPPATLWNGCIPPCLHQNPSVSG